MIENERDIQPMLPMLHTYNELLIFGNKEDFVAIIKDFNENSSQKFAEKVKIEKAELSIIVEDLCISRRYKPDETLKSILKEFGCELPDVGLTKASFTGESDADIDYLQELRNFLMSEYSLLVNKNFKIGRAVLEFDGDPECGEGVSLKEAIGVNSPAAAEAKFYNQWSINELIDGVGASAGRGFKVFKSKFTGNNHNARATLNANRTNNAFLGTDTVVCIFDTSPFSYNPFTILNWDVVDPSFPQESGGRLNSVRQLSLPGVPDARDHGLFVASLLNTVAPEAELRLYRVLNDSNRGKLSILIPAIMAAIVERVRDNFHRLNRGCKPLVNTVFNFSLGVHAQSPLEDTLSCEELVPGLYQVLKCASDLGATIVAASGNDSHTLHPDQFKAQVPACYDFVIGVGSIDFDGNRSSFSNEADVCAPGGGNNENDLERDYVIGRAMHKGADSPFAFWKGTSFSAPLISGLAAVLWEKYSSEGHACNEIQDLIKEEIYAPTEDTPESPPSPDMKKIRWRRDR